MSTFMRDLLRLLVCEPRIGLNPVVPGAGGWGTSDPGESAVDEQALERPDQAVRPAGDVLEAEEAVRPLETGRVPAQLLVGDGPPAPVEHVVGRPGDLVRFGL